MNRRLFLVASAALALAGPSVAAAAPRMLVRKSPTCGCCGAWVDHVRRAGLSVEVREMPDDALYALKERLGIAPEHMSCHTAEIDGYVIEGHVPANDIARLLKERPRALGLSVPGMPVGSPGMEMGDRRDPFDTLLLGPDGTATVFASHG